jgi:cell wall-associated NlpC family hydrolase
MTTRADIVACARTWIDTPYHHQGRLKDIGVDCIGVPLGVAHELGLVPANFDVKGYSKVPDGRSLLRLANEHMVRLALDGVLSPGMVIVVAINGDPQHFGIVGDYRHGGVSIIHANSQANPPRVVETRLMFHRTMRLVAAYDMPGVTA